MRWVKSQRILEPVIEPWPLNSDLWVWYCVKRALCSFRVEPRCQSGTDGPHKSIHTNVCQAVCLPCAVLPRHQVHAGICHTGSAQRRSPHYPLWTRTDVISLSVSLSSLFPPSLCLTLASFLSLSPPFFFYLSVYLNLILFLSSFLTLHPLSLSLFDPLSYIVSLSCCLLID